MRVERSDWTEVEWIQTFGVGSASVAHFGKAPTEKQLKAWAKEDAKRDARRSVPFGFRS